MYDFQIFGEKGGQFFREKGWSCRNSLRGGRLVSWEEVKNPYGKKNQGGRAADGSEQDNPPPLSSPVLSQQFDKLLRIIAFCGFGDLFSCACGIFFRGDVLHESFREDGRLSQCLFQGGGLSLSEAGRCRFHDFSVFPEVFCFLVKSALFHVRVFSCIAFKSRDFPI